jgi:hypothetical protein
MLSKENSMLHKEDGDSSSTSAPTSGSAEMGETISNHNRQAVRIVRPLLQSSHSTKEPDQPPPGNDIETTCVLNISGHLYEVLVRKHITFVNGIYYFDGAPLIKDDPRIISIDKVKQGCFKVQAQQLAAAGEVKSNATASSMPGTLFSSSNEPVNEKNNQVSVVDSSNCCCMQ